MPGGSVPLAFCGVQRITCLLHSPAFPVHQQLELPEPFLPVYAICVVPYCTDQHTDGLTKSRVPSDLSSRAETINFRLSFEFSSKRQLASGTRSCEVPPVLLLAPSWILKRIQELRSNGCFSPLDTSENVLPRRSFRKSSTVEANKSQYILSYVQKHDSQRETLSKYDFLTVWCIPTYKQTTMVPITCRYK